MRFTAAARSGAVSASVPSRSNSTARLAIARAGEEVIHVAVATEAVALRDRVVAHADELVGGKAARAAPASELRGLNEALIVVRDFRQELQDVFGADHREEIALRVAVDRGEEHLAARSSEPRARRHHGRR